MMPGIIGKALGKRNEAGLVLSQLLEAAENDVGLRLFPPINMYKSTRRERLNLYRCVLTPDAWPTWTSSNDATATHGNTVTARHPTASRLRRHHLVSGPQRATFHNTLAQKVHMTLQFS